MSMSDAAIRQNVENELAWEPSLRGCRIGVTVDAGVVSLVGTVGHYADRYKAEEVAKRVAGVRALANELEVKIPIPGERSDADIASAAANALKWNVSLSPFEIKVIVTKGWLTLSGQVNFGYQKMLAEGAVRFILGVRGITNEITVKPAVKAEDVKKKIEAAFMRQAHLDAKDIEVGILHDTVTLKGHVHSWREKDDAAQAAWNAPGIAHVDNQLFVEYS